MPAKRAREDAEHFIKQQSEQLPRNTSQKNENILNEQEETILLNLTTTNYQNSKYESSPYQPFSTSTNETISSEMLNSQSFLTERTKTNITNEDNTAVHILPSSDDIGM